MTFTASGAKESNPDLFPDTNYPKFVSTGKKFELNGTGEKVELPCLFDSYRKFSFLMWIFFSFLARVA